MNEYISYVDLRRYRSHGTDATAHDDLLKRFCREASRKFERACLGRAFYPTIATKYFDFVDSLSLPLARDDLLEWTALIIDDTAQTLTDFELYPANTYPKSRVDANRGASAYFDWSTTPQKIIAITGTWGYHERWDDAWVDTLDTVQNATQISAAGLSLTFTDIDGDDENGDDRCIAQSLLKIGDEFLYVTATNTTSQVATVVRGVNGSTAAAHLNGVAIYRYAPMDEVVDAVRHLAAWMYAKRDTPGSDDKLIVPGAGVIVSQWPAEVRDTVELLKRRRYA